MKSLDGFLKQIGVVHSGYSKVEGLVPENWRDLHYALSVFYPLSKPILRDMGRGDGPTKTYFAQYRALNALINQTCLQIGMFLEEQGFEAVPVPASQTVSDGLDIRGIFSHRMAATLSGSGWIGKSGMFIHNNLGPGIRMGTVLTNKVLEVGEPIREGRCGNCRLCVVHCPAMAIEGVEWHAGLERNRLYDAKSCSDYMKEAYMHIGRGSVCGICMSVCPYNRIHEKGKGESI
ncbi:epoxyqueuosine reductase [Alkalibacter rhizosphaerae]|uniref:Epoxyqueuosine reductase n=1 Tax=Alkalibacter rhizosphaerae TaxID=2815577 RepID=A0A975AHI1_9FIRM|nr:4Fe-4S double cluster binding domain-containing protein [Alkalibacter rhizosphaerae]QSX08482.1 epoxyqueuosine reductase [Alkalibacter rhizosphaerae]